jgi:glycosyltransferase involved in cell wall biosynthesis
MIKLQIYRPKSGGPRIFMDRLAEYMQENDMVRLVKQNPDIYLSTVWSGQVPKGVKWVHRAASVYYNSKVRKTFGQNRKIYKSVKKADCVIYQSKFAKKLHNHVLGVKSKRFSIIYNGFDKSLYENIKPRKLKSKYIFIACGNWRNSDKRGKEMIDLFLESQLKNAVFYIIGNYDKQPFKIYRKTRNLKIVGHKDVKYIVSILKSRPYFVHLSYVEACSNAVIEALSFGCPVLHNNIGATPEIVKGDGVVARCDNKFVFQRQPINTKILEPQSVIRAFRNIIKKHWNINRPDLTMENCSQQYLKVFQKVLS